MHITFLSGYTGLLVVLSLLAGPLAAQPPTDPGADDARLAYAVGFSFARNLQSQGIPPAAIDEAFLAGVGDRINGEPGLLDDQISLALQIFQLRSLGQRDAAEALLDQFGVEDDQLGLVNSLALYRSENLIAYSLGLNVGRNLMEQSLSRDANLQGFIVGVRDQITGNPRLSDEQLAQALVDLETRTEARRRRGLDANLAVSRRYMEENRGKPGVISLPSGLQYSIMQAGSGTGESPNESDSVLVHFHGMLIDGTVVDSSVNRGEPELFGFARMVPGWIEALKLMKVGDQWRLFIPPELGFGEAGAPPAIPPNAVVIFNVELLEIR